MYDSLCVACAITNALNQLYVVMTADVQISTGQISVTQLISVPHLAVRWMREVFCTRQPRLAMNWILTGVYFSVSLDTVVHDFFLSKIPQVLSSHWI